MILLGTQYYRPPFPDSRHWNDDMARMVDSGLNTVQLWVTWAWVEAKPGVFRFDDYDELVSTAERQGLNVVLSTIAAIHPCWIHREVPGSEMIDNLGNTVVSSNRIECHYGLTPGGCFDHPGVWERMAAFFDAVVRQYRSAPNLAGWDAWNELRWNVHADGLVCYCPHTLKRFRNWLDERHGGLAGINRKWRRRYESWDEVRPGKMPRSPYTEMMAFCAFMTWRSSRHAHDRYEVIKGLDPDRPVTVHGGQPTHYHAGDYPVCLPLDRGNDWDFAERLDGIGTSSFPIWEGIDDAAFACRIDSSASATGGKQLWLSELQGGRAAHGFNVHDPVPPDRQQRWIWTGLSRSAKAILFWCWRDEVFGCESGGFGLTGADGFAEERLGAMKQTGALLRKHEALLEGYVPDPPEVGVFFSPWSCYLHWSQEDSGHTALAAVQGYQRALARRNIPHRLVEEAHLESLNDLKVLFMPRAIVLDDDVAKRLRDFVAQGGALVCESECGAFDSAGFYRPPEERFPAAMTGAREVGRRRLQSQRLTVEAPGGALDLPVSQWLTPLTSAENSEVWASDGVGALVQRVPCGEGFVVLCASYFGEAYLADQTRDGDNAAPPTPGLEGFVEQIARHAGVLPYVATDAPGALVRTGRSGDVRLVFVFAQPGQTVSLSFSGEAPSRGLNLIGERTVEDCTNLDVGEWGVAVLASDKSGAS